MKTIFISCYHPHISRNVLEAGVLERIIASGTRVVVIVPPSKKAYFTEVLSFENVIVEAVAVPEKTFEQIILLFAFGLFNIQNRVVRDWKKKNTALYIAAHVINNTLAYIPGTRRLLRAIASRYLVTTVLDTLFKTYTPDLVVTTDSFYREDRAISITAKKRGVKTVAMIRSWDNATTKGIFLCDPDFITVPTQVLKDELIAIHHVPDDRITVTGWPHYDSVQTAPHTAREPFCASLGLDPKLKTILFAPGGEILYKHDRQVLMLLKRLLDSGAFVTPVQFLVRFPPGDVLDVSVIEGDQRFIIDKPGTAITARRKENEISKSDNAHLEDSLFHSDLVLTLVSTMAIDGAVFDKPVVILGFDVPGATEQSVRTFSVRLHFRKILGSGLLSVPQNEADFLAQINAYLSNPALDREKRAELVSRYAFALDGKSAERVANAILTKLP